MIQQLETVLARVIDWLKYEEAKNGARVTLDGENAQPLELAYASQIVTNSETAVVKLRLFRIGLYLSVLALWWRQYPRCLDHACNAEQHVCSRDQSLTGDRQLFTISQHSQGPCYARANTRMPFAGMTMVAEVEKPCNGLPAATTPPPLPAICGFGGES